MDVGNLKQFVKIQGCRIAHLSGIDRGLRYKYRKHLLVVMYHGVSAHDYSPPVWTQLPVAVFERQIQWLAKHYHPVSLTEVVDAVTHGHPLPDRAMLVTFDDGLKNNATVAYPVLKKYEIPAAIFLTVDFIGTDSFFWVDELWLIIQEAGKRQLNIDLTAQSAATLFQQGQYWQAYHAEVEYLKRIAEKERLQKINALQEQVTYDKVQYQEDFGMLSWQDVISMDKEGLIEFGAHTATHRILTATPTELLEDELFGAKNRLESRLGHRVDAFCYPNGRFGLDYLPEHREQLRKGGYKCAFTTNLGLCDPAQADAFSIPRISVANDILSNSFFFQMNASGLCEFRKKII